MVSVSSASLLLATATLFASAPPLAVDAHGVLAKPGPAFHGTEYAGGYSADVPMSAMPAVPPDVYAQNSWADIFGRAFKLSKYKSLREFLLKNQDTSHRVKNSNPMTPECGFSAPEKQQPQPLPDNLEWYGGQHNHPGPCEAWCDNELVLPYTVNCQQAFPKGIMKYDKAKCVGKNRLTFYWMATLNQWQVYINCVKIGNGPEVPFNGGSGNPGASNATTPSSATASAAPKPTSSPIAADEASSPATKSGAKCTKRTRRD